MDIRALLANLNALRPATGCCSPGTSGYCATYVGPLYGRRERLLLVGLDHGSAGPKDETAESRQQQILKYRSGKPWNQHYRGCVRVAAEIMGLACKDECRDQCRGANEADCALCCFAQLWLTLWTVRWVQPLEA